ncbi:MAG: hypothetical protein K0R82_1637 [Flavipsychrobacter sp.]|jgi:di/tricarboxylate transporter|nr:hypothetical protein [Flavipsychrobacter sp.]
MINTSVPSKSGSVSSLILSIISLIDKKQGDYRVPFFLIVSSANIGVMLVPAKICQNIIIISLTGSKCLFSTFDPTMILKFIIWSIIISLVLRFVMRFLFPVIITKVATDKLAQMQKQMEDMQRQANTNAQPKSAPKAPKQVDGDYIEYEEVK